MKTIVTGCSWTDRNYKSHHLPDIDTSWKKWDEHLGDSYGWDIINVGQSGAGNDYILDRALEVIHDNDSFEGGSNIERCVVALSEWARCMLPNGVGVNPGLLTSVFDDNGEMHPRKLKLNHQTALKFFEVYPFDERFQKQRVKDNLYKIYRFIDTCNDKDIEVIIFQMIPALEAFKDFCSTKEWLILNNMLLNDPYFARIEQLIKDNHNVKIMGWPFNPPMGGSCMLDDLEKEMKNGTWAIDTTDGHPNAMGHEVISNLFMKWYSNEL